MGVWDAFSGREASATASPSSSSSSDLLEDTASGGYQSSQSTFNTQDVGDFMTSPGAFNPSALHPLAGLNQDTLDYLALDDSQLSDLPGGRSLLPSRGWSDDLCYGTGVTYLSALAVGGTWGLVEGLNRLPPTAPPKLRLNSALNAITRRGPFLGNSAGVVAMMYNGINSTIGYYRGKHDSFNSVAAGGISGMIFKCTRGVRPMIISGSIVGSIAGGWAVSALSFYMVRDCFANFIATAYQETAIRALKLSRKRPLGIDLLQAWRWSFLGACKDTCSILLFSPCSITLHKTHHVQTLLHSHVLILLGCHT